jgi:hypothetical protein
MIIAGDKLFSGRNSGYMQDRCLWKNDVSEVS